MKKSGRFTEDFASLLISQFNQKSGYLSDLMALKKKMEAPKHLKPLEQQAAMVSISNEDYQKLDSRKQGI